MGGKATDTGSGYTGGLTPYAQNLFGGSSTDNTSSGPTGMQNLGQQIMQASNKFSAQQGGPEEQAIAGIGNALVNKFTQPMTTDTTPNLFGGPTPTFTPPNPFATNNMNNTNTGIVGTAPISFQSFQPGLTLQANPAGSGAQVPKLFG